MTPPRLLCVGALTMDTVYRLPALPRESGKYLAHEAVEVTAGMATSAAIAAARLGGNVELWASLGDDPMGDRLLESVRRAGVGNRFVRRVSGAASPRATILVDASGERMVVAHYAEAVVASPSAFPSLTNSEFGAVLVDARWVGAAELALNWARQQGVPAILDADVAARSDLLRLLPLASHVVASSAGATLATGETDPHRALECLADMAPGFIAITLGADGSIWRGRRSAEIVYTPAPKVRVVDTNAAGDVFHGTFALALAEAVPVEQAIELASAAAALKCTRFGGAVGAPTRDELIHFMANSAGDAV